MVSIIDGSYLVTQSICRWWLLYHRGYDILARMPGLGVDIKSYETIIVSATKGYFLLSPFGKIYIMFGLRIKGNEVYVNLYSSYGEDIYPDTFIGLLVYLALETVRRGFYIYDPFLRKFKSYYDKVKEEIPEKYTIYLEGKPVNIGTQTSIWMWDEVCSVDEPMEPPINCNTCPFASFCPIASNGPLARPVKDIDLPVLSLSAMNKSDDMKAIITTLGSLNMDHLFTLNLLMFARNMSASAYPNIGVLLKDSESPLRDSFFYLRDGKIHANLALIQRLNIKVYEGEKDVTYHLLAKMQAVKFFTSLKSCKGLDKLMDDRGYDEKEKRLVYLSFLTPAYQERHPDELIPISGIYAIKVPETNPVYISSIVFDSKPYRDGLVDVDVEKRSIVPTPKLIEIFKDKCGGGKK